MKIKVYSEIGKLKKVLLHRPGKEVERQYPEIFEHTLFDDIMYVEQAQKDHDFFAQKLKDAGVKVLYIERQVAEIFDKQPNLRKQFIEQFIKEGGVEYEIVSKAIYEFLNSEKNNIEFVNKMIAGVKKTEVQPKWDDSIESHLTKQHSYPFFIDPIPNLLFQRDPIASIFDGMNLQNMTKPIRKREAIFYEYLFKYHPEWKEVNIHLFKNHKGHMEGGDVLVMNRNTIFIGISERTTAKAVEQLSLKLFNKYNELKNIIGIKIPESHATMHLDTVLTQLDYDKFSVDMDMAEKEYLTFHITHIDTGLKIKTEKVNIEKILKKHVNPEAKLLVVAGGDYVSAKAEQWNDGANCLALEPGVVFVYDRNIYTNALLEKAGVKLIKIPSGELSRGRGGPRCMSMPLEREDI